MSAAVFCPATMCPLFSRDGSPWTGDKNAPCAQQTDDTPERKGCLWYSGAAGKGSCDGCSAAGEQVAEAHLSGSAFQIGPVQQKRDREAPRSYDCARAAECQWQRESGENLCPPRLALSLGLDPKVCAY